MSALRHNIVTECPVCSSPHVVDHCKHCDWWACRKCGALGKPGGGTYSPKGNPA